MTTRTAGGCVLLLLLAGCASAPRDDAPSPADPAPVQQRDVAALEGHVTELQTSMTELLERIDVLNERMNSLERGAATSAEVQTAPPAAVSAPPVTELPHISVQPVPAPRVPSASPPAVSSAVVDAGVADLYRSGLMQFGQNRFADARRTFQQVFDANRSGELADNALYWIGETWYAAGNYNEAMKWYRRVTTEYAESNKAPDALLKTAIAYEKTGDLGVAKSTLEEVISRYPYSGAAATAKLELKRIRY